MKDATFSSARLLALYDRISDAEDAIPRLRRFVLDLAVRGKLVEQDAGDEPAAELLRRITIQKPKGGKQSNRSKGSSFPFTLPMGWSWTTLSEISTRLHYGYSASADVTLKDVRLLRITDIQDSRVDWEAVPGCAIDEKSLPKYLLEVGDMLIARTGGTIGKTFLVKEAPLKAVFASYLIRVTPSRELLDQYIKTFCESGVYWDQLRDGSRGGGQPNVNGQTLGKMFVPLPPIAEQHRIVAKVDELMALCDQLEQARAGREAVRDRLTTATLARLTAPEADAQALPAEVGTGSASGNATNTSAFQSHARFALQSLPTLTTRPDQIKTLRQTILNLAVRGKLVKQDPNDEPAAELLRRITIQKPKGGKQSNRSKGSSFPFTLPMGWSWTTLSEISTRLHYGYSASADVTLKDVRLLRITDIQDSRVDWEAVPGCAIDEKSLPKYLLEVGDMLIARTGGTIGKTFLVKEAPLKAVFASYLIRVTPSRELLDQYIKTFCESGVYWDQLRDGSRGGGQPNVNGQTLGKMFVPLPPIAEQHRIVAKVDALMALCDQLEASLTTTAKTRSKLLGALLHEALEPAAAAVTSAA